MLVQALLKQLIRDLKANWKKSALLGVLLIVGLCFWLPPLVRAVSGKSRAPTPPAAAADVATSTNGNSSKSTTTTTATAQPLPQKFDWQNRSKAIETDPLVRSVEVAAIQSDPFRVDNDQFPPPVLFAEEPKEEPKPAAVAKEPTEPKSLERLVLKSTIVGVNRRAAFINSRLYHEGKEVRVDGESYLLSAVYPRRVILKQGDREFELKIFTSIGLTDPDAETNGFDTQK